MQKLTLVIMLVGMESRYGGLKAVKPPVPWINSTNTGGQHGLSVVWSGESG